MSGSILTTLISGTQVDASHQGQIEKFDAETRKYTVIDSMGQSFEINESDAMLVNSDSLSKALCPVIDFLDEF